MNTITTKARNGVDEIMGEQLFLAEDCPLHQFSGRPL